MTSFALCATMFQAVLTAGTGAALPLGALTAADNTFTWHGGDGSYRFGMRGTDQWRVETRDRYGSILSQYHYHTPDGGIVQMKFSAGPKTNDLAANQRDLLVLTDRVGGGGELLLNMVRPDVSGFPPYYGRPSSEMDFQEPAFDNRVNPEPTVGTLADDVLQEQQEFGHTRQGAEAALANIWQSEGVMAYGALLTASVRDPLPVTPGTEDTRLSTIVTNVQHLFL